MGGFEYVVGSIVFILVVITIRVLLSSCLGFPPLAGHRNGLFTNSNPSLQFIGNSQQHSVSTMEQGIDEATLRNYPKLIYAQAKLHQGNSTASSCSICLADYKDTDVLRLLPHCGHIFHLKCVDSWLRLHATCPVCRNSPLAEATAVSSQRLDIA
ncbi:RING-H2 finger protein ATL70 [Morella rubra]|uniref:RING-type E3 ubiquitin transferase n=1 Tax=Morella rubra TaxID=262757 RepID=A0A6A1V2P2_9ROSI|nr:RING-H2 finger protein ATL70 [Morella rubra]KAB1206881.1 RING-H2 finger protein ATL70 [Morella rubra]